MAFLISANLTEAALDRNIEMVVLLRDRSVLPGRQAVDELRVVRASRP